MKTIITGFVALAMIGAVAAVAPTLDGNDPHLQPRTIILQTEEQAAPDTRLAAQDAAARQAEDTLREIVDGLTDYEIMRGVVYEPDTAPKAGSQTPLLCCQQAQEHGSMK